MTDTQPTKFCANCKWAHCYDFELRYLQCSNPSRKTYNQGEFDPVTGLDKSFRFDFCEHVLRECGHKWWELRPVRPSLTQRIITKWKEWWG